MPTTNKHSKLSNKGKQNKIFISWSGENSKKIAKEIKFILEDKIFEGTKLKCFVSDEDITSGEDWLNKIKDELMNCKWIILCITKENVMAPWIYYEAGATVARDIPSTPLLINCDINLLHKSPLNCKQCTNFDDEQKFIKMINDINEKMSLLGVETNQMDIIALDGYKQLKEKLSTTITKLENVRFFDAKYVYPSNVTTIKKNTLYICTPMASIETEEYKNLRDYLLSLKETLEKIGFTEIICPMMEIEDPLNFEGSTKALNENFENLKQIDSMLIIYPKKVTSSVLVEIGYGLALSKKMVIFYKEYLPYMLEDAGSISHVNTIKFDNFTDITKKIKANGIHLFKGNKDG